MDVCEHGAEGRCKKCYMVAWRKRNAERVREYSRTYYIEHLDEMREKDKRRYEVSGDQMRAASKAWKDRNAERVRQYEREYIAANSEAIKARHRAYYQAHQEKLRAYSRSYHEANTATASAASRKWKRENPDRVRLHNNRRRAQLVGADADLSLAEWLAIVAEFEGRCAYCNRDDRPIVIEHMTPLSRGGKHTAGNVVPACGSCNSRKHSKTAEEFAGWQTPPQRSV